MDKIVLTSELKKAYAESLGVEMADKLVEDAIKEAGLTSAKAYPAEDILKICEVLKSKPGFIGIMSGSLQQKYKQQNK